MGVVCAVGLTLEAVYLFVPAAPAPTANPDWPGWPHGPFVSVTDVDLGPWYDTSNQSDTNFLLESDCGCAPVNVTPGQQFLWWIKLTNTDPIAHHWESVRVDSPFTLVGTSPPPPQILPAHGAVNVTLTILVPGTTGWYDVTGWVLVVP